MMNTKEIANKLVDYCKTGQWDKAQAELYAENAVSREMPGQPGMPEKTEGLEAIKQKGEYWASGVEEFFGVEIDGPIVAGDHFSCTMHMDIKMKGKDRTKESELCIYKVENGKIVSEQFFY